jgi:hypothetical protein
MRIPQTTFLLLLAVGLFCACGTGQSPQTAIPDKIDFNFHVKPLLSDRCFKCHGPDDKTREAGLRFDTEEGLFAALTESEGFAIVPGEVENSQLIHRLHSTDPDELMPPPESNLSLSETEIEILTRWIEQGAEWKEHWAFEKPVQAPLPEVQQESWVRNEIDHFVLARMEALDWEPAPEADKAKWLRRVSFDLTGLPPRLEALEAFLADESEAAHEKAVDRLLASPAYGERMASVWLDAARYADSHGYQDDRPRTMWPWRDWVIKAFNDNLSYKDFVTWQLAGDLLPDATYEQKLATGFNRNHGITQEGGVVNEEYITEYVADRTNTLSTAFLGLTLECSRCHDHKYDPFSQKDYYQLFAFFNTLEERGQVSYFDLAPVPNMRVEDPALEAKQAWLDSMIVVTEEKVDSRQSIVHSGFGGESEALDKGLLLQVELEELTDLRTEANYPPGYFAYVNTGLTRDLEAPEVVPGQQGNAFVFDGHNFLNLGDVGDFEWYDRFTIGAWVKPTEKPEKGAGLLSKRNGEQKRGGYDLLLLPDLRVQAALMHHQGRERIEVQSLRKIPLNQWTHIAYTYEGSGKAKSLTLYINGEAQPVRITADSLKRYSILNGNDLLAGHWTHRNNNARDRQGFTNGVIDGVRVYERALSEGEVAAWAGRADEVQMQIHPDSYRGQVQGKKDQELVAMNRLLDSLRREWFEIPYVMIMQDADTPRTSYVLERGAYDAHGEVVRPGAPAQLLAFDESFPQNRLGLAQWLAHPDHPLTARVMVNRCWQLLFGQGIVKTAEDFGSQGDLPSHPELLDWLAVDFVENGWDVKRLLKQMALSATYRQSAKIDPEKYKQDPENRLLARGPNQRLSAEMIRDNALAVSGLLQEKVGGHWVKPYQPPGIWKALANQIGENKYRPSYGPKQYRRSLYAYWKRTIPPPMMLTFDASERAVCVVKRQNTNTPLQALVLLNDPQFIEASRALAMRMMQEGGTNFESRTRWAFRLLTHRYPTETELSELQSFWQALQNQPESELSESLLHVGSLPIPQT